MLNQTQRPTIDSRYLVSRRVAIGLVYGFDQYRVDDFALGPVACLAQPAAGTPSLMMLRYVYRPYTASTVTLHCTYGW